MILHPASRFRTIYHRDVVTLVKMGLSGAPDGRIVNAVDEAPMTVFELREIAGAPLSNPWPGVMDGSLARRFGFRSEIATTWQASRQGAL